MPVVAADGAGRGRTLTQLKIFRRTLVDLAIAAYRGRIVKTTGDLLRLRGSCDDTLRAPASSALIEALLKAGFFSSMQENGVRARRT